MTARRTISDTLRRSYAVPAAAISETQPRSAVTAATAALTSGTLRLAAGCVIPGGVPVSQITVISGTTALSGGANQWFALLDHARNKLAVTADDTTAVPSRRIVADCAAAGRKPVPVAAGRFRRLE